MSMRVSAGVVFAGAAMGAAQQAQAGFHLWSLSEVYSNSSGTVQFIELRDDTFGGQQFVNGTTLDLSNIGASLTNHLTFNHDLAGNSFGHTFLIGTAGLTAAGGPAPDFFMPDGFLFNAGGSISYFNA